MSINSASRSSPASKSTATSSANKAQSSSKTNKSESKSTADISKAKDVAKASAPQAVETVKATQETQEATRTQAVAEEAVVKEARLRPPADQTTEAARGIDAPNLAVGSTGAGVTSMQDRLNSVGANLDSDGKFGPKTQAAVRSFQQQSGLTVDGIMGPKTTAALDANIAAGETMPGTPMQWGATGPTVTKIQNQLNEVGGYNLQPDGKIGLNTYNAIRDFQSRTGLGMDGVVGPRTQVALNQVQAGTRQVGKQSEVQTQAEAAGNVAAPASNTDIPNGTAQFERVSRAGQTRQMQSGRVTVNGNTYQFNSGGGGRGNLPPGDYQIRRHRDQRSDKASMMVDGVGYSFSMSDKFDPRVGGDPRTDLRIHPDGGGAGTIGCLGIVGNGRVQQAFRRDMLAEIQRNGGSYTLHVAE